MTVETISLFLLSFGGWDLLFVCLGTREPDRLRRNPGHRGGENVLDGHLGKYQHAFAMLGISSRMPWVTRAPERDLRAKQSKRKTGVHTLVEE